MNSYEEKQERKRQRMEARADRLRSEGQAKYNSGFERLRAIPFGQPILVDHYSAKGDRSYRRKAVGLIDKGCELMREAENVAARAAAVGTGGISSDDPDAVTKLKAELATLQDRQAAMKEENDAWRKAGNKAGRQADGTWVEQPNPPYRMSNNSANMRRIKDRIEVLERNATRETVSTEAAPGITVIQNAEENRVQIKFPGKPSVEVRAKLKSFGFRWSPRNGAWQRHLNGAGIYAAGQVVKAIAAQS